MKTKMFFARLLWPIGDAVFVAMLPSSPGDYVDAWTLNHRTGVMERSGVRIAPTDELEGCINNSTARNATLRDLQTSPDGMRWVIAKPEDAVALYWDTQQGTQDIQGGRFLGVVVAETRAGATVIVEGAPKVSEYARQFQEALNDIKHPSLVRTDDREAMPAVLRVLNRQYLNQLA